MATLELPAGLVLPGPTGAPDGEPLSTRITLPGHTGLLALRHYALGPAGAALFAAG